jgi:transposase-like protein
MGWSGKVWDHLSYKEAKAMISASPFKWRYFEGQIILYRDLEEMMAERGLGVDHTTIYRWVQKYAPELEKRCKPHLKCTNDSWRADETYIKVKGKWLVPVPGGGFGRPYPGVPAQ